MVRLGWRAGVWAPAGVALVLSALVALAVRDSPERLGRVSAETAWAHARGEQTEISSEIAETGTEIAEILSALFDGFPLQVFAMESDISGAEATARLLDVARALLRPLSA